MILQTKEQIEIWLKRYDHNYHINDYELIDITTYDNQYLLKEKIKNNHLNDNYIDNIIKDGHQYIVNSSNIDISNNNLKEIPFQFYKIDGTFNCSNNFLISLRNCPEFIERTFICEYNQLISLIGCPQYVGHSFYCSNNQLKSLKKCPISITGDFDCSKNQLTSLEYFPDIVTQGVYLVNNLKLLKYKSQSNNLHIQNMSDNNFLNQRDFQFWQQFHLEEKIMKENSKIIDDFKLNDIIKERKSLNKL